MFVLNNLKPLLSNGYRDVQPYSKCGWIIALQSSFLHAGSKNMGCLYKNLSFSFIFPVYAIYHLGALLAIDSPHKLLSRRQPRYSTQLYCLLEWSWKQIYNFASVLFLVKRIAFVLSSPKWIDNLLSMNHSQRDENSLFKTFSIFCMFLCC